MSRSGSDAPPPGFDLPLHDDAGIVGEADLEQQLARVRESVVSPLAGVFGPGSMTWCIDREAMIFLAAGRALLLQLAHPWVAAAVAEHSRVTAQPIVRFHRTFNVVFALVFGSLDQAFAAARSLHRRHTAITGFLPDSVGPFKAGSRYCANNISGLRWVYATLIDSALLAHDLVFDPLSAEERARHYAESRLFAGLLGIPHSALPADNGGLAAYVEAMCYSDVLTVGAAAKRLAAQIFDGSGTWVRIPASYKALTAGMLPDRLRTDFGFEYGETERRAGAHMLQRLRRSYFRLPGRIRFVGPYHEHANASLVICNPASQRGYPIGCGSGGPLSPAGPRLLPRLKCWLVKLVLIRNSEAAPASAIRALLDRATSVSRAPRAQRY